MKKFLFLLVSILILTSVKSIAQEDEKKFGISFSGYIKTDYFFDTRQTVAAREGYYLLWPAPEVKDPYGKDVNAKSNFNFLSIQSRIRATISGPNAFGARTSGVIEGDFFAQANENINLFRMRHAFISLNWDNTELIAGQTWNPMFITKCFPRRISFNPGVPMQALARNPQIRITQKAGNFDFIIAALAQRDHSSRGPDPSNNSSTIASSEFLRNSTFPDLHLQVHYTLPGAEGTEMAFGAGGAYKTIVPRIASEVGGNTYKVDEKLSGLTAIAFACFTMRPVNLKFQARYGENIPDLLSVSGFAVQEITDPLTGERTYTPLQNISFWSEVHTKGEKLQFGVFGGYLKNMGTKEEMSSPGNDVYGLGTNIESIYRISPRVVLTSNTTKFALEVEYTAAAYGSDYDVNYIPANTNWVANTRILLSAMYNF